MKNDSLLFWKYVAPSVFGAVIGGSFAIVDAIFIGLSGGKNGLAATALTWPLVMLAWLVWLVMATSTPTPAEKVLRSEVRMPPASLANSPEITMG